MPLEPPYGVLWKELKEGQIVAFLGAGASLSGRPPEAAWQEQDSPYPPKGSELAGLLADEACFPSTSDTDRRDLAKVASYFEATNDRALLRDRLRQVFVRPHAPGVIHQFLAATKTPLLIVTTNYDNLIEQAFEAVGRPYHLVMHVSDQKEHAASVLWWKPGAGEPEAHPPVRLPLSLTDTPIIYKMHGGVSRKSERWDNFVITEEDYMDFLSRMTAQGAIPARFMMEFRRKRFLFLGYALGDWNLRVILRSLRSALSNAALDLAGGPPTVFQVDPGAGETRRSWSIQLRPSELERWLWEKRQVSIYDLRIEDFVARLRQQMEAHP
jgi:hypothetical protein